MAFSDAEVDVCISDILSQTQWQSNKEPIPEFLASFTSAQPVRLVPQGREINLGPADLMHPFLAFSRRRRTKAYAENLVWDAKLKKFCPVGPPLEIPKDYIGWFEVVTQGSQKDVSCQTTIAGIVKTKCKQFLVRTTIIGHLAAENNNAAEFHLGEEARVYPGEILNIREVITKQWKTTAVGDSAESSKKKKEPTLETKFLHCIDTKDRDVYLPFAHPGQFYGLFDSSMKSKHPRTDVAYYIYDLLSYGFPLLVKEVFGWPPADFPEFSGFLRILGLNRPDSLILRSMKPGSCVIVELPMDADVKIEKMANPEILSGNKPFERFLGHSCDRIYPYLIGMKHMDIKYPVIQQDKNENESESGANDVCRMARPRDMNNFNPLDIFPPLDEPIRKVSESWTLSFKDPDFSRIGQSDLVNSESVVINPENENVNGISKNGSGRHESVVGNVTDALQGMKMEESGPGRRDRIWHKRADMEQGLLEREADC